MTCQIPRIISKLFWYIVISDIGIFHWYLLILFFVAVQSPASNFDALCSEEDSQTRQPNRITTSPLAITSRSASVTTSASSLSSNSEYKSFPWLLELLKEGKALNIQVNTSGSSPADRVLALPNLFPDFERTSLLSQDLLSDNSSSCITRNKRLNLLKACKLEGRDW